MTASVLVITKIGLDFSDTAYFWLLVGVICQVTYTLHGRIADARYGSWDRLYYNSVFSVIVLAPASLYLEEAFEALNFHHDRQGLFLAGCVASALIGGLFIKYFFKKNFCLFHFVLLVNIFPSI